MSKKLSATLEIFCFYGLIFSVIWVGQKLPFRPPLLVAGLALLGACFLSNKFHSDSREAIGLSSQHFKPCLHLTARFLGLPLGLLMLWTMTKPLPPLPKIIFGLLGYPLWAFSQEYALLSFMANRFKNIFGERVFLIAVLNGFLFSLVHYPNPVLLSFCFIGGAVFTAIFFKTPHLVPIALAHALAGFLISWIFQDIYCVMMIGPAYLKWAGLPSPH